jgi:DNA-binding MarR family transcriptional regulator
VTAPIDRGHLRQVGLNVAEVKTLSFLAQNSGEARWHGHIVKPDTQAMIDGLIGKQLVELVTRFGGAVYLRLTDQGRTVAAQLEAMSVAPKIEVANT